MKMRSYGLSKIKRRDVRSRWPLKARKKREYAGFSGRAGERDMERQGYFSVCFQKHQDGGCDGAIKAPFVFMYITHRTHIKKQVDLRFNCDWYYFHFFFETHSANISVERSKIRVLMYHTEMG